MPRYNIGNSDDISIRVCIMKTLFVSDLDGTFLTKKGTVSAYSITIVNHLIDCGVNFTIATARSALSAKRAVEGLQLKLPAVTFNGGLICNFATGEELGKLCFSEYWKREVLMTLRSFGICPFIYGMKGCEEQIKWIPENATQGMERYVAIREGDRRLQPVHSDGELLDSDVFYFKCIGPRWLLERAWNVLKFDTRFICIFHQETYHEDFWMEISPRNATKATGVRFLKEKFGFERIVCFGDTANDSDMFDLCDESYAVKNADDWLKAKATGVIGYCEEDGVAKWLEDNALKNGYNNQ